ncbi:hypothetical protein OAB57_01575 [Bacteriovoracaceae bacterium]|nr:hypothetical protein [Bacteriovoracaceae bacterium]
MISTLVLKNYPTQHALGDLSNSDQFVLKTCQRTLILSSDVHQRKKCSLGTYFFGRDAYAFLLETICGLQSNLVLETEIVAQFKEALQNYLAKKSRSSNIIRVLEKVLKDSKKIRTDYLSGIPQQSYSYIAKKIIQTQGIEAPILILGSGLLAKKIVQQLEKQYCLTISARSTEKIGLLLNESNSSQIERVPWLDYKKYMSYPIIISCINAQSPCIPQEFFDHWQNKYEKKLFIDFSPTPCIHGPTLGFDFLFPLESCFSFQKRININKQNKISSAKRAILELSKNREQLLKKNYPSLQLSL